MPTPEPPAPPSPEHKPSGPTPPNRARPERGSGNNLIWYLLAVVSTFAGNLTLLGSIANLIVAEQARPLGVKMGVGEFLKVGLPLTLIATVLAVGYFMWLG